MTSSFVAYPSSPEDIGVTIRAALELIKNERPGLNFNGWEENDIAGRFISEPILEQIANCDILSADVTKLNFRAHFASLWREAGRCGRSGSPRR